MRKILTTLSIPLLAMGLGLLSNSCSKDDKSKTVLVVDEESGLPGEPGSGEPVKQTETVIDPLTGEPIIGSPTMIQARSARPRVFWAHRVANAMTSFYNRDAGLWVNANSLSNPQAFIALIDFMELSNNRYHTFLLDNESMGYFPKNPNLASDSYQNTAWWGLAVLRSYDLMKESRYLVSAKGLADYLIANAWDDKTCGGGMWKDKQHSYLDASSTEIYIKLMASLHNRIPGDTKYLAEAQKAWKWFVEGPFNEGGLFANFIQGANGTCKAEPSKSYYAHNQGVILGAAAELYLATLDLNYVKKGLEFANKSMPVLSKDGFFSDLGASGCNKCSGEGALFKGIYVRYLRQLAKVAQSETLYAFLDKNADKAWNTARSGQDLIGYHWAAAHDMGDLERQIAGLDLINSQIFSPDPVSIAASGTATASTQCVAHHNPKDVNDGSAIVKWCGAMSPAPTVTIDLGSDKAFSHLKMINCGGGTEALTWNTKDFSFAIASDVNGPYKDIANVKDNQASFWDQAVTAKGRYLRLTITNAGDGGVARINEIIVEP